MIDVTMTGPGGIVLATAGKYCPDHVRVQPELQEKTVTPTADQQVVTADSGKVGLAKVTVAAGPIYNYRRFEGEVTQIWNGDSSVRCLLVNDPVIAEHYADDTFSATVVFLFDKENFPLNTIITTTGCNTEQALWWTGRSPNAAGAKQTSIMISSTGSSSTMAATVPIMGGEGVNSCGYMLAESDGSLYIYPRSQDFSIRPSSYFVEIKW